ncbi:MAG: hypothetical protein HYU51_01090 [Candidatus Rokubacteria bacterium]|nr:hypothetical protein [Candidatus Rokubacteria bacterium]
MTSGAIVLVPPRLNVPDASPKYPAPLTTPPAKLKTPPDVCRYAPATARVPLVWLKVGAPVTISELGAGMSIVPLLL